MTTIALTSLPRMTCGTLAFIGGVVMVANAIRYRRMIQEARKESYFRHPTGDTAALIIQCFLALFIIGYVVGTIDLFFRDVEPIYLFVSTIFFFASIFLSMFLKEMRYVLRAVRGKTVEVMNSYVNSR